MMDLLHNNKSSKVSTVSNIQKPFDAVRPFHPYHIAFHDHHNVIHCPFLEAYLDSYCVHEPMHEYFAVRAHFLGFGRDFRLNKIQIKFPLNKDSVSRI